MNCLTTDLLGQACDIFLARAYPAGAIPHAKRAYLQIAPDQPLEALLTPPVCEVLRKSGGELRGYALRLGSVHFPHLKLQVVECDQQCIFSVDTHDAIRLAPSHPEAARWAQLQAANRRLKDEIEREWDAAGLLTFNGLLRHELARQEEGGRV
jgi:hypothetical protein